MSVKTTPLTFDVGTISKLELKKDDVIVIQADLSRMTQERVKMFKDACHQAMSGVVKNKVIILDKSMAITVLTLEENQ